MILSAALSCVSLAADVLVYPPHGAASAGPSEWEVLVVDGGRPTDRAIAVSANGQLEPLQSPAPLSRYRYTPVPGATVATFSVNVEGEGQVNRVFQLRPPPVPALSGAAEVEAAVGTSRVELRFPRAGEGGADALLARVSEGRILEVRTEEGAVVVAVEPGADRQARMLAVALVDLDDPSGTPVFSLVRLRARPQLALTTESGNQVTVRVGRRTYGPFVADAGGTASFTFDALPGETTYEVTVTDDLGNTQRSSGPLPASPRPVLVGVERPAASGAVDLWLAAWTSTGAAWTGAAPACRSGVAGPGVASVGRGVYMQTFPAPDDSALFDPRVECGLGEANLALRLPRRTEVPTRIELRVYPEALSADFPIAQVQASLVDTRDERVSAGQLAVSAEAGELQLEGGAGVLRGEYRGQAAVERGGDTLVARWDAPPGEGRIWSLEAYVGLAAEGLGVRARARDRRGRPLRLVPVTVELGVLSQTVLTDERGWASAQFPAAPAGPAVVHVRTDEAIERFLPWLPGTPTELPDITRPDLERRVELPIRAGRVRQVFLDVEPRPLLTGSGAVGIVVIRMLDAAGNPVLDEDVRVEATAGVVAAPTVRADGSLVARYEPPAALTEQTVRITAHTTAGTVATDVLLTPRPVHGALALSVGWISNFGAVSAPTLSLSAFNHIPFLPRILAARVGVTVYNLETTVRDAAADADIDVHATLIPFDVGVVMTERWGRRSLHAGLAVVIAPYALAIDFGGERGLTGMGLASPGLAVQGGGGYRLGSSEIYAEARFLLYTASSEHLAFEGSVGGASLSAGYRLLY